MTVINTSPAIHLHAALPKGLASLPTLVGDVVVPFEVNRELAAGQSRDSTYLGIASLNGFHHRNNPLAIHRLLSCQIDVGEAAVIQTALDESIDTVILDDLKARRIARSLGLRVTGTIGVLLHAKKVGALPSMKSALEKLNQRGMWIAPTLAHQAIKLACE